MGKIFSWVFFFFLSWCACWSNKWVHVFIGSINTFILKYKRTSVGTIIMHQIHHLPTNHINVIINIMPWVIMICSMAYSVVIIFTLYIFLKSCAHTHNQCIVPCYNYKSVGAYISIFTIGCEIPNIWNEMVVPLLVTKHRWEKYIKRTSPYINLNPWCSCFIKRTSVYAVF